MSRLPDFLRAGPRPVHVRWMIARDLPAVVAIDREAFGPDAWPEDEFLRRLQRRNCIGYVAEPCDEVAGYMVYTLQPTRIELERIAVAPHARRRSIGNHLLVRLADKLYHGRTRLVVRCRESNTDAHLWLRACGLRAERVDREAFADTGEDGYVFVMRQGGEQ